jgi:DNA-damage-inducible protein J
MSKTAVVTARIDPDLKRSAEHVFTMLGLNTTQAITLFFKQVELQQGLPFAIRVPNKSTQKALDEAQARSKLSSFNTVDELFDDLGIG